MTIGGRSRVATPVARRYVARGHAPVAATGVEETRTDDFNRADGDFGGNWSQSTGVGSGIPGVQTGGIQIAGNVVRVGNTGSGMAVYQHEFTTRDQTVGLTVTDWALSNKPASADSNLVALIARKGTNVAGGGSDFYTMIVYELEGSGTTWSFDRNGFFTGFNFGLVSGPTPSPGDVLTFDVRGIELKGYLNGTLILSAVDSNILTGGYGGFFMEALFTNNNTLSDGNAGTFTSADLGIDDFTIANHR